MTGANFYYIITTKNDQMEQLLKINKTTMSKAEILERNISLGSVDFCFFSDDSDKYLTSDILATYLIAHYYEDGLAEDEHGDISLEDFAFLCATQHEEFKKCKEWFEKDNEGDGVMFLRTWESAEKCASAKNRLLSIRRAHSNEDEPADNFL